MKKVVRIGRKVNRLFCLDHLPSSPVASTPTTLSIFTSCISFDIWYKRLGHASSAKSVMCFSLNMILIRKVIVAMILFLIDFVILTMLNSFSTFLIFQSPFDSNLSSTPPIGDPILQYIKRAFSCGTYPFGQFLLSSFKCQFPCGAIPKLPCLRSPCSYLVCISIWLS